MKIDVFKIDGKAYNLPVIKFVYMSEVLDGAGTGRMQGYGWPMFREPEGVIKNIDIEIGLPNTSNPDFVELLRALDSFGDTDFRSVTFVTPMGEITQEMYGASYQIEMRRITRDGITYWGTLPISFRAKQAIS